VLAAEGTKRPIDAWILSKLARAVQQCDAGLQNYDFHLATEALYDFWYTSFCDVYLVSSEPVACALSSDYGHED
jgi:valyl-tRNA synthetase